MMFSCINTADGALFQPGWQENRVYLQTQQMSIYINEQWQHTIYFIFLVTCLHYKTSAYFISRSRCLKLMLQQTAHILPFTIFFISIKISSDTNEKPCDGFHCVLEKVCITLSISVALCAKRSNKTRLLVTYL